MILLLSAALAGELLRMDFDDPSNPFGDASPYAHPVTNTTFEEDGLQGMGVVIDLTAASPAGGGAAWFDGASALEFPGTDVLEHLPGEPFTLSFWFRSPGIERSAAYGRYAQRMHILGFGSGSASGNFDFDIDDADGPAGVWTYWNGTGSPHVWSPPGSQGWYTDDRWYQTWFHWDGATATGYIRAEGEPWTFLEATAWTSTIGGVGTSNRVGASSYIGANALYGYYGWVDALRMIDGSYPPDLCPDTPAPDMADTDGDGIGDACDQCQGDDRAGDRDADGTCDDRDVCPDLADPLQRDFDADGIGDVCEESVYLTATGSCPGTLDAAIAHVTPGGQVAIVTSALPGSFTVPSGGCAGTVLGLAAPARLAAVLPASRSGAIVGSFPIGGPVCGKWVVVVDLATCRTSAAVQLP